MAKVEPAGLKGFLSNFGSAGRFSGRPRLFPDGFDRDPRVEGIEINFKASKPAGLSKSVQTRGFEQNPFIEKGTVLHPR